MVVSAGEAPLLEAREVGFGYGRQPVLSGVSLRLAPGELLGVIGPNGSGKSTLLGLLAGMLPPAQGRILLRGRDLASYQRTRLAHWLGLVPQSAELAAGFTVMETVLSGRFSLMGNRLFENQADRLAAERAVSETGLTELAHRRAGELSGGERQRLVLARALAAAPRIMLLDEPTSALDMKHQLLVMGLLEKLCREKDMAVCLVSHDLNLASLFCHRLLLLAQGRALAGGEPDQVLTPELLEQAYGARVSVDREPHRGRPRVTLAPPPQV